jgi:hypothetical protein
MSPRSVNRFNQREVSRELRAARLAGESVEPVEIDPAAIHGRGFEECCGQRAAYLS